MLYKKLCMYAMLIIGMQTSYTQPPLCISLGDACGPALMLRALSLRTEAFPFDWIISPFNALYSALTTDFVHFLTDLTMREDKNGVIDYYGFHFTHDWPTVHNPHIDALHADYIGHCQLFAEWEKALPLVKEKYRRRIERLKSLCSGDNKIFFIRSSASTHLQEEAIMIRDFFKTNYPQLDFTLLILSWDEHIKQPWNLDGIQNFYIPSWNSPDKMAEILAQVDPAFSYLKKKNFTIAADLPSLVCEHCLLQMSS